MFIFEYVICAFKWFIQPTKYLKWRIFVYHSFLSCMFGIFVAFIFLDIVRATSLFERATSLFELNIILDTPVIWANATPNFLTIAIPIITSFLGWRNYVKTSIIQRESRIKELFHRRAEALNNRLWYSPLHEFDRLYQNIYDCNRPIIAYSKGISHQADYLYADGHISELKECLKSTIDYLNSMPECRYEQEHRSQRTQRFDVLRFITMAFDRIQHVNTNDQIEKYLGTYINIEQDLVTYLNLALPSADAHFSDRITISIKYDAEITELESRNSKTIFGFAY